MAKQRTLVVGGGLAGLAAAMRLAELGVDVDLMSLTPVKRSHSVCAQGGINSVNAVTRQQGDNEWMHFEVQNTMFVPGPSGGDEENSGLGLKNVVTRLRLLYKDHHTLTIRNEGNLFHIILTLQLI